MDIPAAAAAAVGDCAVFLLHQRVAMRLIHPSGWMETKMSSGREIPTQYKQIEEKENNIQQRREIKE